MYVTNALEECYRFTSPAYKEAYELLVKNTPKPEYLRDHSAQTAYLLDREHVDLGLPKHYAHLVDNLLLKVRSYSNDFHPHFDIDLENPEGLAFGLCLVRNIRNHIAHGVFPIIEDPEYTIDLKDLRTKKNIISLLGSVSRIAAINIQMLLALFSDGFKSAQYTYLTQGGEPNCNEYFKLNCNLDYLLSLHINQKFGLNENDYFSLYSELTDY